MSRTLDVYLNYFLIGHLMQNRSGEMTFRYSAEWLETEDAIPISYSLPLREQPFSQRECRGFFAGILPEDVNREVIARILGISARNDYAMLEQIGRECAGAVIFVPAGTTLPDLKYDYLPVDDRMLTDILGKLSRQPLLVGEYGVRLSLAGAQDKIAVHVDAAGQVSLPLGGAPSTHILKPAIGRFPNSVSNELLCLELANSVGVPAVTAKAGRAGNNEYILVKRYDRIQFQDAKYPLRLHQEDLCQALGVPPERKYQNEGGPGFGDCFALLRNASSNPAVCIQNFLNMAIFNIIVGNHDAHGKNFSLLFDGSRGAVKTNLAPAYDILSTVYYPELTPKMAMKIGKEYHSSKLKARDIEEFATNAGLSVAAVRKRVVEISEKITDKLPAIAVTYPKMHDLVELIDRRATRIMQVVTG